jgi:FixJ family two-component response regulator
MPLPLAEQQEQWQPIGCDNSSMNRRSPSPAVAGEALEFGLISVVDDDESMREAVRGLMKSLGYTAEVFASAEEFLNSRQLRRTSCLIADVHMPGMTGLDLHRHLVASGKIIPTILITAYPDDSVRERALGDGVVCYLSKPFDENDLLTCIHSSPNI